MIYFIYPSDETTKFLLEIPNKISARFGHQSVQNITVLPNDESYSNCLDEIAKIPSNSVVIFMGHGQEDKLWGAESDGFVKKPFILKNQAKVFSNKHLLCLSCNSNDYIKGTFSFSKIISSIGFGSLPTDMTEVENSKKLKELGINDNVINKYKEILVELVSESLCDMLEKTLTFAELSNILTLRLNKKISEVVLKDKHNADMKILSDLLFQMRTEMVFI